MFGWGYHVNQHGNIDLRTQGGWNRVESIPLYTSQRHFAPGWYPNHWMADAFDVTAAEMSNQTMLITGWQDSSPQDSSFSSRTWTDFDGQDCPAPILRYLDNYHDQLKASTSSDPAYIQTNQNCSQKVGQNVNQTIFQSPGASPAERIEELLENSPALPEYRPDNASNPQNFSAQHGLQESESDIIHTLQDSPPDPSLRVLTAPLPQHSLVRASDIVANCSLRAWQLRYPCFFQSYGCDAVFNVKGEWKRHILSQHMSFRHWECSECDEERASFVHKGRHKKAKSESKDRPKHTFRRRDLLLAHVKRMHGGGKHDSTYLDCVAQRSLRIQREYPPSDVLCHFCQGDERFASFGDLLDHISAVHFDTSKDQQPKRGVDEALEGYLLRRGLIQMNEHGGKRDLVVKDKAKRKWSRRRSCHSLPSILQSPDVV